MGIADKLKFHFSGVEPDWLVADAAPLPGVALGARWPDGRLLLAVDGPLTAGFVVDAYLHARAAGVQLTLAHDEAPTSVARRTAERFGVTLLDAAPLAEPEVEPAFDALHATLTLAADAPTAPAAPEPVVPVFGLMPNADMPAVADAFADAAWTTAGVDLIHPVEAPTFELPAEGFFTALERMPAIAPSPVAVEADAFPTPPAGFFGDLERIAAPIQEPMMAPPMGPIMETAAEPLVETTVEPMEPVMEFEIPQAGMLESLERTIVEEAVVAPTAFAPWPQRVAPTVEIEVPPWPDADVSLRAPTPAVEAAVEALLAEIEGTVAAPAVEAETPITPDVEMPVAAQMETPAPAVAEIAWGETVAAEAELETPSVEVAAEELAALPWNTPAPAAVADESDVEMIETPRSMREPVAHPTAIMPDRPNWGLPWPRPVAPADGLAIADPSIWRVSQRTTDIKEALDRLGGSSFGAITPEGSGWLRRIQTFEK